MAANFEYIEPVDIELKRQVGYMLIQWNDGHAGRNNFMTLRWNCPCAGCAGEMGAPGKLDFTTELKPEEYQIEGLEAVGLYALRPIWKDGHDSGLYTYEHMRNLCECEECIAKYPERFEGNRLSVKFKLENTRRAWEQGR